jgi:hypothetical protein
VKRCSTVRFQAGITETGNNRSEEIKPENSLQLFEDGKSLIQEVMSLKEDN